MRLKREERYKGHLAPEIQKRFVCAECHGRLRFEYSPDDGSSVLSCWDHPEHGGFASFTHAERERLQMLEITETARWARRKELMEVCRKMHPALYEVWTDNMRSKASLLYGSEEDEI